MTDRPRRRRAAPQPLSQWWELPTQVEGEDVIVRLPGVPAHELPDLLRSLRAGRYTRPFVIENGRTRRLHFGLRYVQAEMALRAPEVLTLDYTRKMMAALLLQPDPRRILVLGLGGGSLSKFCYRHLSAASITTVEIDREVIGIAESFFALPRPDARFTVVHADAADFLARETSSFDLVLMDACDAQGTAPGLAGVAALSNLRARLAPRGVVAVNLVGGQARAAAVLRLLVQVFEQRLLLLPVASARHRLAFAGELERWPPDWDALLPRAAELQASLGLDFPLMLRMLKRHAGKSLPTGA